MSRSVPPPWREPIPPFWLGPGAPPVTPTTTTFKLSPDSCSWIATALGLKELPPLTKQTIELAISVYKTHIRRSVTAGENIAAIDEALREADRLEKALSRFTDVRRSGVGDKTFRALSASARELQCRFANSESPHRLGKKSYSTMGGSAPSMAPLPSFVDISNFCTTLSGVNRSARRIRSFCGSSHSRFSRRQVFHNGVPITITRFVWINFSPQKYRTTLHWPQSYAKT
jgi:hypothetical protein